MIAKEKLEIDAFSRGLLPHGEAAIYSSCQRLRSFLKSKGEDLDFSDAFILWRGWIGEPLLSILSYDRHIIGLLGESRFSIFYEAMEELEKNNYVFSQDKVYTIAEKAHYKMLLRDTVA